MYVRRPLAQRGGPRRRLSRWRALSSPTMLSLAPAATNATVSIPATTTTAAATGILFAANSDRDFDQYVRAECSDVVFTTSADSRTTAAASSSLRSGADVASLPATHAILNKVNSAVWLRVLTCLQQRRALSSRDCAGAIRYLPAFTYRPLLPWLWTPTVTTGMDANTSGADAELQRRRAPGETGGGLSQNEGGDLTALAASGVLAEGETEVVAEVYNNMSFVALERAQRVPSSPPTTATATADEETLRAVCSVADFSTAGPQLWTAMARSLVSALPAATSCQDRVKLWHDIFFTLRAHSTWNTTAVELAEVAHPQLLAVFRAFYTDVQSHDLHINEGNSERPVSRTVHNRDDVRGRSAPVDVSLDVVTVTPPILLRKLRALYRQHRHSAMLFAELYTLCVTQEEKFVDRWRASSNTTALSSRTASAATAGSAAVEVRTTALLMDVDLAVYFASLPGRRHSGLDTPSAQWSATLQHLSFLVPRLHFLQRCLQAQRRQLQQPQRTSAPSWEPWRRAAAVLMNVCVWVENNNQEATRCCAALRRTVEALQQLSVQNTHAIVEDGHISRSTSSSQPYNRDGNREAFSSVHTLLGSPTTHDITAFLTTLVSAAGTSMQAKAAQLHYGPTDGLFGVSLLSVAVYAIAPQPQPTAAMNANTKAITGRDNSSTVEAEKKIHSDMDDSDVEELLRKLHIFTHRSKSTPAEVWAALRNTPHVAAAARYGLVTVGYRLFRDCVVPPVSQTATVATARRVFALLRAWASAVGRPLGLDGRQVSALWQLRWTQAQLPRRNDPAGEAGPREDEEATSAAAKTSGGHRTQAKVLLQRLTLAHRQSRRQHNHAHHRHGSSSSGEWVCGCGFRNSAGDDNEGGASGGTNSTSFALPSLACVACVLRDLVPHCWECPSCHTISDSGVAVPYCLHCGAAHPSLPQSQRHRDPHHGHMESAAAGAASLVYVCSACHAVAERAPPLLLGSPAASTSSAAAVTAHSSPDQPCHSCCRVCGSEDTGYFTTAFTWTCGCGAVNPAQQDYCDVCSRAAETPSLTCPQCQRSSSHVTAAQCARCHFPHPRRLAAEHQTRLVHCPACHGLAPSTSQRCPYCASTTLTAVAALLPTVADAPWVCLHCGVTHHVRSVQTGQLRAPPMLHLRGLPGDVFSSSHTLSINGRDRNYAGCSDDCCDQCGTRRLPLPPLWSCAACGEMYNTAASCQRCAALAPGVPAAVVSVWQCAICHAGHPSWVTRCDTPGCGGRVELSNQAARNVASPPRGGHTTSTEVFMGASRYCYSPWECAECGHVTLSSHLPCCTACGAATPASVWQAACTSTTCMKAVTTAAPAARLPAKEECAGNTQAAADNSAGEEVREVGAIAQTKSSQPPAPPSSRLAQVESFLLRAAESESMLLGVSPDIGVVAHVSGDSDGRSLPVNDGEDGEAWEEAYRAAVMSF